MAAWETARLQLADLVETMDAGLLPAAPSVVIRGHADLISVEFEGKRESSRFAEMRGPEPSSLIVLLMLGGCQRSSEVISVRRIPARPFWPRLATISTCDHAADARMHARCPPRW